MDRKKTPLGLQGRLPSLLIAVTGSRLMQMTLEILECWTGDHDPARGGFPWLRALTSRPDVYCAGNAALNFLLQNPCYISKLAVFLVLAKPVPRSYSTRIGIMIVSQLYQEWRRFQPSGNRAREKVTVPAPEMADTALNGAKTHR